MVDDPLDDFLKWFKRMFGEFDSEFTNFGVEKFGRELDRGLGGTGFKIEILDHGDGRPKIKVSRLREIKPHVRRGPEVKRKPRAEIEAKPIKCMLETNVAKVEKLDEVLLTMQAPGVKKEDVDVRQLGRALEIVARKPTGEAYFATFELPSDALSSGLQFELKDGMLVIKVPRRRRLPRAGVR
jgi:HSP20 family molecular chaperone IbpA